MQCLRQNLSGKKHASSACLQWDVMAGARGGGLEAEKNPASLHVPQPCNEPYLPSKDTPDRLVA